MKKAYITVFFSLTLSICMSLLVGLIYGARENAIRFKIRDSANISMESAFGEYERELWDRYGLVFVDMGYGNAIDSTILPEEHFIFCMNENFDEDEWELLGGKDLLKLKCDDVVTNKVRLATDHSGLPLMRQAVACRKYENGIMLLEEIEKYQKMADTSGILELSLKQDLDESRMKLNEVDSTVIREWVTAAEDAIWEEKEVSLLTTLRLIFKDVSILSTKAFVSENLLEKRVVNKGNYENQEALNVLEKGIYREYLLEHLGNYVDEMTNTALKYETEYLISGRLSDAENLESVINRILLIREAANMQTLYSDAQKMEEIKGTCETICGVLMVPEVEPFLEILITSLLSFIESVSDVRLLVDGKKVPMNKLPDQWKTSIGDILSKATPKEGYEEGMEYEDYLRILLYLQTDKEITERFENVVEENVRVARESTTFRLDNCFDAWSLTAYIFSEYGYNFTIQKEKEIGE